MCEDFRKPTITMISSNKRRKKNLVPKSHLKVSRVINSSHFLFYNNMLYIIPHISIVLLRSNSQTFVYQCWYVYHSLGTPALGWIFFLLKGIKVLKKKHLWSRSIKFVLLSTKKKIHFLKMDPRFWMCLGFRDPRFQKHKMKIM